MKQFEPTIVAFSCRFCAQPALEGKDAPSALVRVIRIHCIGKIDALHVLRAFEHGADAVVIAGAAEGQCHFIKGTAPMQHKVGFARHLLGELGIEPERLEVFSMQQEEPRKFTEAVEEMCKRARALGPNPFNKNNKTA
jgi:coenzyme F420-reducing hydrogenase delta subunit